MSQAEDSWAVVVDVDDASDVATLWTSTEEHRLGLPQGHSVRPGSLVAVEHRLSNAMAITSVTPRPGEMLAFWRGLVEADAAAHAAACCDAGVQTAEGEGVDTSDLAALLAAPPCAPASEAEPRLGSRSHIVQTLARLEERRRCGSRRTPRQDAAWAAVAAALSQRPATAAA